MGRKGKLILFEYFKCVDTALFAELDAVVFVDIYVAWYLSCKRDLF